MGVLHERHLAAVASSSGSYNTCCGVNPSTPLTLDTIQGAVLGGECGEYDGHGGAAGACEAQADGVSF